MKLQTLGNIKVVQAKNSEYFKERKVGFVAVSKHGSEYYANTQSRAIARLLKANGSSAI